MLGVYPTKHWWETNGEEVSKEQGKPQSKGHPWAGGELLFQEVRVFQGQERAQAKAWKGKGLVHLENSESCSLEYRIEGGGWEEMKQLVTLPTGYLENTAGLWAGCFIHFPLGWEHLISEAYWTFTMHPRNCRGMLTRASPCSQGMDKLVQEGHEE